MDHPSFNIGISQIITPNNDQIFYSEDPNWTEQRSKSLHDPALMANQSSTKRKSKKEVEASSKAKDAKTQKKRDRKAAPPISRPTLPMNKTDRINWAALNAYKNNKIGELLGPQHSFEVEFARDIMQQESDSLSVLYPSTFTYTYHPTLLIMYVLSIYSDCRTYVAAFAEFQSN
ncbi:hypothetical protein H5410_011770 [Solanum commersonii]|uniref:Uncharacterized protein n=1 Tax=Solanum commersonii TaxID=4109 RepID=A0A9J6API5_SOLCO|nr:hypothetical protein H5410_011770 [Solanum commersonii]